jgi:hypothetical protein
MKKEKQMSRKQTSLLFITQQFTHLRRKVNGGYTVFFGKTCCILKHPRLHLRCLRPSSMPNRKGYVGEEMTVEKLNSDTTEQRLVTHRFPDC